MATDRDGIAVFGGGETSPGSPAYENALIVGRRIAAAGRAVVTGGYGGVMEAACRGAREAGGEAIGVTCRLFRGRQPNRFLSLEIEEPDLFARTARLFALASGFVILGGRAGTLGEMGMLWSALRAGAVAGPVVLLDDTWAELYRRLVERGTLDEAVRCATSIARDADEAARRALRVPGRAAR